MDREGGIEADVICMVTKQSGADRMECARPGDRLRSRRRSGRKRGRDDPLRTAGHLGCGPAGEGEEEDAAGIGPVHDEMGHTVGERVCLARAGSRMTSSGEALVAWPSVACSTAVRWASFSPAKCSFACTDSPQS